MRRSTLVPALFGAALLVGGVAAPASAQTVDRNDPAGDAPARIDITKVRYTHESDRVRVSAKIPDLGKSGTADFLVSRYEIFEAGYVVRIRQHRDQPAKVSLLYFDHFRPEEAHLQGRLRQLGPAGRPAEGAAVASRATPRSTSRPSSSSRSARVASSSTRPRW